MACVRSELKGLHLSCMLIHLVESQCCSQHVSCFWALNLFKQDEPVEEYLLIVFGLSMRVTPFTIAICTNEHPFKQLTQQALRWSIPWHQTYICADWNTRKPAWECRCLPPKHSFPIFSCFAAVFNPALAILIPGLPLPLNWLWCSGRVVEFPFLDKPYKHLWDLLSETLFFRTYWISILCLYSWKTDSVYFLAFLKK